MTAVWIGLTCVALAGSLFMRSAFPMGDPAIFEYIGRALATGSHLYTDLWDNKLPSIYYVNALWWMMFGGNYELHAVAETVLSGCTFVLFAFLLRALGVVHWAWATLVFALMYLFVGGPLDQTEHYATPLILAGLLLGVKGKDVLAGIAIVLASTFWLPSVVVGSVPLLVLTWPRMRMKLLLSLAFAGLVVAGAFVVGYGTSTTAELVRSWLSYQAGNYVSSASPVQHRYPLPFLSPRYYIESGLGLLVGLIAIFWKPVAGYATRFALAWAVAAVVVVFALGRPSIHYFLPVYPALVMLLALQPIEVAAIRRRWFASGVVAVCASLMLAFAIRDAKGAPFFGTPAAIAYTGDAVRETFGPGAIAMLPWELYLTADALPPSRFFLAQGNVKFARDRDRWTRQPVVFVDAADLRFNGIPAPHDLAYVCASRLTTPYVIHADRPVAGISCEHT